MLRLENCIITQIIVDQDNEMTKFHSADDDKIIEVMRSMLWQICFIT
jgi:hypothetical protein